MPDVRAFFTPPELAKLWRVSPEKIVLLIRGGQLRAFDAAAPDSRLPRFRVPAEAVRNFEHGRQPAAVPSTSGRRQRRSQSSEGLTRFI